MKTARGDIWDWHEDGHWICITTNGFVKTNGECVMGRGVALQAKNRFPKLPFKIGEDIRRQGNHVVFYGDYRIATFPVKHHWREKADISLIKESAIDLVSTLDDLNLIEFERIDRDVIIPRPGCGNGGLDWADVEPILAPILDDRFVVVDL